MAVQQTECYRVVTIGYLKDFIGTLIQDSSNGSVKYVNLNAISEEKRRDDYCPTYSELTSNSLVQTWNPGSTPNGDRDGIVVSSSAILGGNYAANQLVDQKDLSLKYTRFKNFGISASPTTISECGGSSTLSYSHGYTRYNKYMNDSCVTASTSSDVSDTANGEVSWNAGRYGSISYPTYSIGKNGSVSASSRSTTVTATITFRGSSHSDTVTITQKALSGSYATYVTSYSVTTSVSANRSSSASFGCDGGTYSATGTRYYDTYYRYSWTDSCGTNYPSLTSDTKVSSGSESMGSKSGSFSSWDCCNGGHSDSASLSFSKDGYSGSVSFSQSCADCSSDPSCSPYPPYTPTCARGTDNGSDWADGRWHSHPLNLGWQGGGPDQTDSIRVRNLHYRGTNEATSGSTDVNMRTGDIVTVNDWLKIRIISDGGGIIGKGEYQLIADANNTSSPRSVTYIFSTTDTGTWPVTWTDSSGNKHTENMQFCSEWKVEVKQAPKDHYWYGDHSYTTQPVPCGTGPCPGTTDYEGCWATSDCAGDDPPQPEDPDENDVRLSMVGSTTIVNEGIQSVKFKVSGYHSSFGRKYYTAYAYVDGCPGVESCPDSQGQATATIIVNSNGEYTFNTGRGWSDGTYLTVIIVPDNDKGGSLADDYRIVRD